MHINWCILREDKRVELSHDVTFDKALYPGISTFNPAGLIGPLSIKLEDKTEPPLPKKLSLVSESDESDDKFKRNICFEELTNESSNNPPNRSPTNPLRPGYDIVLQQANQKAPQDISSNIDDANILLT
jgi:hypothetical protein